MTLHVVVNISGRDALPVWVLPYVTGWTLSPDMLMDRLVCSSYDPTASFPIAFQLEDSTNNPVLIPTEQWEGLHIKVESIDTQLKNEKLLLAHDRDEWRIRSITEIMQHKAYVWLDEFESWFNKQLYAHKTVKVDGHGVQYEGAGVEFCLSPALTQECTKYFKDEK